MSRATIEPAVSPKGAEERAASLGTEIYDTIRLVHMAFLSTARRRILTAPERSFTRSLSLASTKRRAALFYAAVPHVFGREQHAVAAGRKEYSRLTGGGEQRYLLRRNIHMIEKGLSMRPRREIFAVDYIDATVDAFAASVGDVAGGCGTDPELQWANDVLATYFEAIGPHRVIDRARGRFVHAPVGVDPRSSQEGLSPYARDLSQEPPVSYERLLRLAERRRSVRWFEQRPVPRHLVEKAIDVAALSPSACNRQPFQFRVFDEPTRVHEVASIPMGTKGWVHNIPTFVVIVGSLAAFFSERDRHTIYTDGCLAAMSFLLALESLGLSSCCVNWPDIAEREERMEAALGLAPHERPVMCIAVGYPDAAGLVPFSQKRPSEALLRFNDG